MRGGRLGTSSGVPLQHHQRCPACVPPGLPGWPHRDLLRRRGGAALPRALLPAGGRRLLHRDLRGAARLEAAGWAVGVPKDPRPSPLPSPWAQSHGHTRSGYRDPRFGSQGVSASPLSPQGPGLRRHGRGGPLQPAGPTHRHPPPAPGAAAQLLQLQQQPGQPEQPPPPGTDRVQRPRLRVHVRAPSPRHGEGAAPGTGGVGAGADGGLAVPPRNQAVLFGGNPRYENVPLIGRGSPPPTVRWATGAKALWHPGGVTLGGHSGSPRAARQGGTGTGDPGAPCPCRGRGSPCLALTQFLATHGEGAQPYAGGG